MVKQITIDAVKSVVGYNNVTGNNGNLVATTKSASAAQLATLQANEAVKQQTIMVAKDTLRSTGDLGPA